MRNSTYGHTPLQNMFDLRDVYGIAYLEERAQRRKIRLALIGAGGVAQSKHLPAIMRLRTLWEPVVVAAAADPNEQQGRKVAELYGCRWYPTAQDMLDNEEVDAVEVLSPAALHYEHALYALERGLPVLVEKPFTLSLKQGWDLCRFAEGRGLTLMVVANKRWSPPYRRALEMISQPDFGQPALWTGKFNLGYDWVDLLEEGTIHVFDLARFCMGEVRSLHAIGAKLNESASYPADSIVVSMRFTSGAIGSLYTSRLALSLKPWERVEIYGRGRWLAVEDQRDLWLYDSEDGPAKLWSPVIPNTLLFDEEFGGYMGEIANFLQVVRGKEEPGATGWDGYRACELVVATRLSMERGETMELPLPSGGRIGI